jgi:hypothetical protein
MLTRIITSRPMAIAAGQRQLPLCCCCSNLSSRLERGSHHQLTVE